MTPSWRTVSLGLRLILIGAQTVGCSLLASFAVGCCGSALVTTIEEQNSLAWLPVSLLFIVFGTAVLGRLLCAVGRWFCTATPPEAGKARARIRLTVIFETCSLLSGIATVGLVASGVLRSPELGLIGVCFWLLTTVLGRVCFFAFGWAVAEHIGARTSTEDARNYFRLSLFTVGGVVLGPMLIALGNGLAAFDTPIRMFHICGSVLGFGLLFVAAGLGLYLFVAHFILITDMRRHLDGYQPKPAADDPDREYLEQHLAAGGSADDT